MSPTPPAIVRRSLRRRSYLAGGQTLLPTMKQRLAAPSDVVDVRQASPELKGITVSGDTVTIGAATTHAEVARLRRRAKQAIPALANLASLIGDPAVRHMGTIGGSLANNDPAADYPGGGAGARRHRQDQQALDRGGRLLHRPVQTALEDGEMITKVSFPIPAEGRLRQVPQPGLALCHVPACSSPS
jgi:carbon-monoxide dehydrogenase medium subunit